MSRSINALTNKEQSYPNDHFWKYLSNTNEPIENMHRSITSLELENQMIDNAYSMRRKFRRNAQKLIELYT